MDKYKIVKNKLNNLELEKSYLDYLKKELGLLEEERQLKGVNFDGVGSSGSISDTTGNTAVMIEEKQAELKLRIKRKKTQIEHIEYIISKLEDNEQEVIKRMYVKGQAYWCIARDMHISISTVKRIRRAGMEKMIVGLCGND